MRTLFGIVLGAALTIGGAYVHDTVYAAPGPEASEELPRTLVNWEVANEVARGAVDAAQREIRWLLAE